jgi:glycosyltransferase involved in cell wall biosynthesis
VNGLVTPSRIDAYADAIVSVFGDPERLQSLKAGCLESASEYTIENMADRFTSGILRALAA